MNLELEYYGQNDTTCVPDLTLTGDPGTDNAALTAAGYVTGAIMAVKYNSATTGGLIVVPANGAATAISLQIPYGVLLLGAGQFSSSITPSGSGKVPVVRAFAKFKVPTTATKTADTFVVGKYLYADGGSVAATSGAGKWTITQGTAGTTGAIPVGICTHAPSASEPWLGVAALV